MLRGWRGREGILFGLFFLLRSKSSVGALEMLITVTVSFYQDLGFAKGGERRGGGGGDIPLHTNTSASPHFFFSPHPPSKLRIHEFLFVWESCITEN
jgi:hypothetical protein